ncbi:unnamed protein product [Symbiodinium sp. CCMP2456]|nr:unnamed protein product [Symbiodinium sp. CCMP2456]
MLSLGCSRGLAPSPVRWKGAAFPPRRAEAAQRPCRPTLSVLAAAAVPVVSSSSVPPQRRARRWPTGHVVRLRHLETKHSFEFIIERRSHAVLLSSPLAPFERVALPAVLPETGVGPDILDLNVARASGNDKDWPLFWCVSSWDSDGSLCLEISSARRPDLVLSASIDGQLVLQRRPSSHLGRKASSTFVEVFCQEHLHGAAAASATVSATPLRRSESEEVQSLAPSRSLLPEDLRSFARNGYVVVKKAVPDFLWRPACALVHSEIGSHGMIQGGDTSNSGFESVGKLQGKTPHRAQFRDLLLHPSSAAGSCAAQMLGWRSISAVLKGRQLPAQVALRFPDAILAEEKARSWAAPLQLGDLLWHTDGCSTRQCSRHPFSLLVGVALTDTRHAEKLCGNLCVWPGSHAHLRREPALKICDAGSDAAALCREGAALRGYEGLMPCPPDAEAPGQALPLDLRAGDCVILHPHTAHAAAPRYTPSGIRIMVYFRLRATPAMARPEPDDEASESCRQVFFDLPGVASALGENRWSEFLRAAASHGDTRKKICMPHASDTRA